MNDNAPTIDVTPLHRDLYTAVAVGGIETGKERGIEAINARWCQTSTTLNQMLELARALDDPYIAARLKNLKDEKRQFFGKVLRAFKKRFNSACEMVESDSVKFVSHQIDTPLDDHCSLAEFASDANHTAYAVSYDSYGNVRSQYSVGFINGAPIIPTGDTVNRPYVVLEKYALAHAMTQGRATPDAASRMLAAP